MPPPKCYTFGTTVYGLGHRIKNYLTEYSIFINGEQYPARPVKVEDKCAEALAEYLLSDHSLVNFDKQSSFQIAVAGVAASKTNGLDGMSVITAPIEPYIADTGTGIESTGDNPSTIGSFVTAS
jgi:hypothetical protein